MSDRFMHISFGTETDARPIRAKFGPLENYEFIARVTDISRFKEHDFVLFCLPDLDLTGLPIFIMFTYTEGQKFPHLIDRDPMALPKQDSVPIGHVIACDNTTIPKQIWVKGRFDLTSGISDTDRELFCQYLGTGALSSLALCYVFSKDKSALEKKTYYHGGGKLLHVPVGDGDVWAVLIELSLFPPGGSDMPGAIITDLRLPVPDEKTTFTDKQDTLLLPNYIH